LAVAFGSYAPGFSAYNTVSGSGRVIQPTRSYRDPAWTDARFSFRRRPRRRVAFRRRQKGRRPLRQRGRLDRRRRDLQVVRFTGSFRCWFVKKYCWLVYVREKYCSGWRFTIIYDKSQPNERAAILLSRVQTPEARIGKPYVVHGGRPLALRPARMSGGLQRPASCMHASNAECWWCCVWKAQAGCSLVHLRSARPSVYVRARPVPSAIRHMK